MSNINKVIVTGNVVRDAEYNETASGTQILKFTLAVNDYAGQGKDEHVNWVPCTCFGSRAKGLANCLEKGTKVAITGKLHYSSYEDRDGNKKSSFNVNVDELEFMSSRSSADVRKPKQEEQLSPYDLPF